jgi:Fe-S oxidoreductase
MIENVIATTNNCRYCLMCRHVCPVGHVTRKETLTPHGWGLTIASIQRGLLELDDSTIDVLYSCADCGTCRANCVTDQPLPSAIAAMRSEIVEQALAPPEAVSVHENLKHWSNPYQAVKPIAPTGQGEVAIFVGDDAHFLGNPALEAALTLLKEVGVKPVPVGIGRNNGYLASSLGFPETAAALAQATMDELAELGASTMLVLTPGDYYTFKQLHDDRHGLAWPADLVIQEVVPFLAEQMAVGNLKVKQVAELAAVAYVDPTHSVRVATRYEAPRQLLSALIDEPVKELFWRRERAHPCGNGALQYTKPHIANHLAYSRLADALDSGAETIVTEDPGSLAFLNRFAPRFSLKTVGLYELLADNLV